MIKVYMLQKSNRTNLWKKNPSWLFTIETPILLQKILKSQIAGGWECILEKYHQMIVPILFYFLRSIGASHQRLLALKVITIQCYQNLIQDEKVIHNHLEPLHIQHTLHTRKMLSMLYISSAELKQGLISTLQALSPSLPRFKPSRRFGILETTCNLMHSFLSQ